MPIRSYHLVYLRPDATDVRWSFLHCFFHPGMLEHDKQAVIFCTSLDMTHHIFLALRAKNFSEKGTKAIHLPYSLVDGMLELSSHQSQLGFGDQKTNLE